VESLKFLEEHPKTELLSSLIDALGIQLDATELLRNFARKKKTRPMAASTAFLAVNVLKVGGCTAGKSIKSISTHIP
jgi:hypothetical protein